MQAATVLPQQPEGTFSLSGASSSSEFSATSEASSIPENKTIPHVAQGIFSGLSSEQPIHNPLLMGSTEIAPQQDKDAPMEVSNKEDPTRRSAQAASGLKDSAPPAQETQDPSLQAPSQTTKDQDTDAHMEDAIEEDPTRRSAQAASGLKDSAPPAQETQDPSLQAPSQTTKDQDTDALMEDAIEEDPASRPAPTESAFTQSAPPARETQDPSLQAPSQTTKDQDTDALLRHKTSPAIVSLTKIHSEDLLAIHTQIMQSLVFVNCTPSWEEVDGSWYVTQQGPTFQIHSKNHGPINISLQQIYTLTSLLVSYEASEGSSSPTFCPTEGVSFQVHELVTPRDEQERLEDAKQDSGPTSRFWEIALLLTGALAVSFSARACFSSQNRPVAKDTCPMLPHYMSPFENRSAEPVCPAVDLFMQRPEKDEIAVPLEEVPKVSRNAFKTTVDGVSKNLQGILQKIRQKL